MNKEPRPWRNTHSVRPFAGECIASIAVRLAPHGFVKVSELLSLGLGLGRTHLALLPETDEAVRRLAIFGSYDFDDLKTRCWSRTEHGATVYGRGMPPDWLVTERRRLAPARLIEDGDQPWIRILWQIGSLPCDPETGEMLVDRCDCGEPLWWARTEKVWQCIECGADVRQQSAKYVPSEIWDAARELAAFIVDGRRPLLPKPFDTMPERSLFAAMNWFGYFHDLEKWLKPAAPNALTGFRALQQWPNSFDQVLRNEAHWWEQGLVRHLGGCIQRADDPQLERILRDRACEILGLPSMQVDRRDRKLDAKWLRRDNVKVGLGRHYDRADSSIHWRTARKALSSK